jgi:enolase
MAKITKIIGREVLDSRGFPTVEVDVLLDSGHLGRAIVPSGASTGTHEALELRDGDPKRYLGKGVLKAVSNVNEYLAKVAVGRNTDSLQDFDKVLIDADGTPNKNKYGANAILAVSLAAAKASASSQNKLLASWINEQASSIGYKAELKLPIPLMNVINGGAHADNGLDIQEFMIVPHGFTSFREAIRAGCEIFHHLKKILLARGLTTSVGDEGGFAPTLGSNKEALTLIMEAIHKAGYSPKTQISLALDVASSEFFKNGSYQFKEKALGTCSSEKLKDYYLSLAQEFPLISVEDGFAEDDWAGWKTMTAQGGDKLQLVGDDLFVTQVSRLKTGIEQKSANAILIKLNQVGTLLETLQTMHLAQQAGFASVTSHRSGESEDATLSHLAVATGCGQVKTGSASRSDRLAKYNELLRLEEFLKCPLAKFPRI